MINFSRLAQRLGKLIGSLNEVNAYRGTTLVSRTATIQGQYTSANPDLITGLYSAEASAQASDNGWISYLKTFAQQLTIEEVANDRPTVSSFNPAFTELTRQLSGAFAANGTSFNAIGGNVSISIAANATTTNVVDSTPLVTGLDGTGVIQDLIIPDNYLLQITKGSSQGATAYAEPYSLVGKPADGSTTDATYPSGSGVSTSGSLVDPGKTTGALNADPNFNAWSGNTPTSWNIASGNVTTNVVKATADPRGNVSGTCAQLIATGNQVIKLQQSVNAAANTLYALTLTTQATTLPSGNVAFSAQLVDAGNGATVAGPVSSGSLTVDATWHQAAGFITTPAVLSGNGTLLEVSMHLNGNLAHWAANTTAGYVDYVHLDKPTLLYPGGPSIIWYSKFVPAVQGDGFFANVTNSGTLTESLLWGMDRLLGLRSLGVRLPTSGTPTLPDSDVG